MSEELQEVVVSDWSDYDPGDHEEIKRIIKSNINSAYAGMIANGYYLSVVNDKKMYLEDGYSGIGDYAESEYGYEKQKTSYLMKIAKRFCIPNSPALLPQYRGFRVEKLRAMIYLTDEQLEQVTITTTRAEIRTIGKAGKDAKVAPALLEQEQTKPLSLSIMGLPKTVYPPDSSMTTAGCGHKYDCYTCHREGCGIRQEDCWCIDAPCGNPFPCDTLKGNIDAIKQVAGDSCQFINLELVDPEWIRAGDKEPVPCCNHCSNQCEYVCKRAKQLYKSEPKKQDLSLDFTRSVDSLAKEFEAQGSCPLNQGSCHRNGEEGEAGKKICTKCWKEWLTREKIKSEVVAHEGIQAPEKQEPAESHDEPWFVKKYFDRNPSDLKKLVSAYKSAGDNPGLMAKTFQENISKYGAYYSGGPGYAFSFHNFVGGIDLEIAPDKIHMKYGRFVKEALNIYKDILVDDEPKLDDTPIFVNDTPEIIDNQSETVNDVEERVIETPETVIEEAKGVTEEREETEQVEIVEADIIQTVPEDPECYTCQDVKDEQDKLTEYVETYRKDGGNFPGRRKAKMRLDAITLLGEEMRRSPVAEEPEQVQPELLILKNNDQRKAFIEAYETWPIWIDMEQTGERYYRYDFDNGDSFVIKVSRTNRTRYDWSTGKAVEVNGLRYEYQEEYILRPGKQFRDCATSVSTMTEYLKDLQKKGA